MRKILNMVPNCITLLNLLSGCVAIIFAFNPFEVNDRLFGWEWCAIMIGFAALFDFLDGAAARLLHAKSNIGKELDSLSDLVSFGVAPAMLLMNILLAADGGWCSYLALFLPLMGALRLAKFNIDDSQATTFKGLPIPANAIFWIGFAGTMAQGKVTLTNGVVIAAILFIGLLMVCNMRMFSLKMSNFSFVENFNRYLLIVAAAVFVIFFGVSGLALTILFYIVMSALQRVIKITVE